MRDARAQTLIHDGFPGATLLHTKTSIDSNIVDPAVNL